MDEVPGDGFAFAVQVGCEEDFGGVLGGGAEVGDDFAAAVGDFVGGFEVVVDVDVEALGGDVADVADGGFDGVAGAEVFVDGFGLGGGFDDDEGLSGAPPLGGGFGSGRG